MEHIFHRSLELWNTKKIIIWQRATYRRKVMFARVKGCKWYTCFQIISPQVKTTDISQDKPLGNSSDQEGEPLFPSKHDNTITTKQQSLDSLDESGISLLSDNPFSDADVAAHYRKVYEDAEYECRHVYDPTMSWTEEEEKNLVRKIDWRVCLWACVMFFGLQVDRGNLAQAVSDNRIFSPWC